MSVFYSLSDSGKEKIINHVGELTDEQMRAYEDEALRSLDGHLIGTVYLSRLSPSMTCASIETRGDRIDLIPEDFEAEYDEKLSKIAEAFNMNVEYTENLECADEFDLFMQDFELDGATAYFDYGKMEFVAEDEDGDLDEEDSQVFFERAWNAFIDSKH